MITGRHVVAALVAVGVVASIASGRRRTDLHATAELPATTLDAARPAAEWRIHTGLHGAGDRPRAVLDVGIGVDPSPSPQRLRIVLASLDGTVRAESTVTLEKPMRAHVALSPWARCGSACTEEYLLRVERVDAPGPVAVDGLIHAAIDSTTSVDGAISVEVARTP